MAGRAGRWLCNTLTRRRITIDQPVDGTYKRCLSAWDAVWLGLGGTLGAGAHVLVGVVALRLAGPAVVLSFLIAAVAALFAGLCYAEFGARVPRAGSAYSYVHVTVGELVAFIVGWNMILDGLFGTASVARGLSMYVDSMTNQSMSAWFESFAGMQSPHFSPYFDFFSFFIVLIIGGLLVFGVRETAYANNVFTTINLVILAFVIIAGATKADPSNWSIPASVVPDGSGEGGFFPYGGWGVLRGAAVCFYGFVGFDAISSTAEELREPRRAIPVAIISVLLVAAVVYASVATVVTMMVPYFLQETTESIAMAFSQIGLEWARWIVSIGAVFGIIASLWAGLLPLARLLRALAADTRLPARLAAPAATLLPTAVIATLSAVLELEQLVMMTCVGTLLAYTAVAACVVLLRYRSKYDVAGSGYVKQMFGFGEKLPSKTTTNIIYLGLLSFIITSLLIAIIWHYVENWLALIIVFHVIAVLIIIIMALQPQIQEELSFKTPLVPVVPCLSIYVNIQLMVLLKSQTWIRVLIWIAIGIPVYILYMCCYKKTESGNLENNLKDNTETVNGKPPVHIYVESPTPPGTTKSSSNGGEILQYDLVDEITTQDNSLKTLPIMTEEIKMHHAYVEDTEEKEANIIDLLDQVIQAEEDSYGEIISLKEQNVDKEVEVLENVQEPVLDEYSLTELSDAGSDASMGNQVLSKYDVIAQVHREDLPKVTEEEERNEREDDSNEVTVEIVEHEDSTAFNDNDSRTDESGYSDTIDRIGLNESIIGSKEDIPYIPTPPPLDENFFASPTFKKSYTISARPSKSKLIDSNIETKPRESIKSNSSYDDTPMVFGSDKQMNFMSKLNNIFQNKISSSNDDDEQRRRSNSTGDVVDNTEATWRIERPSLFMDLKKEIVSREVAQNLRSVDAEENKTPEPKEEVETSFTMENLKSKLESIYAAGGPKIRKTKPMKSNPPTPEESYQTDTSSSESIAKLPKMEKNDTLKRQRTKFGEVLNSLRLSINKDEVL